MKVGEISLAHASSSERRGTQRLDATSETACATSLFLGLDSSLFKSFRTPWIAGEDAELQFRFEFFNTINSTRFNQFNNNFVSPGFGNITSARAPRIMQVGLKFIF